MAWLINWAQIYCEIVSINKTETKFIYICDHYPYCLLADDHEEISHHSIGLVKENQTYPQLSVFNFPEKKFTRTAVALQRMTLRHGSPVPWRSPFIWINQSVNWLDLQLSNRRSEHGKLHLFCDDDTSTLPVLVLTSRAITLPLLQMFSGLCDRQYDLWTRQRVNNLTIDEQDCYNLPRHTVCQSGTFWIPGSSGQVDFNTASKQDWQDLPTT